MMDNEEEYELLVHNDDINTFQHVVDSLMQICGHGHFQAEQCALLIHEKKKCKVKTGPPATIELMYELLAERGLNVEIFDEQSSPSKDDGKED